METLTRRPAPGFPGVFDVPVMRVDGAFITAESAGLEGALRAAHADVGRMLDALSSAGQRGSGQLRRDLEEVERLRRRVDSVRLRLIAAADQANAGDLGGFVDTSSWLAGTTKGDRRPASSDVHLAEAIGERPGGPHEPEGGDPAAGAEGAAPGAGGSPPEVPVPPHPPALLVATGAALDDGTISADHAKVIARGLEELPEWVTDEQRRTCEAELLRLAGSRSPSQLRRAARRVLEQVEPDPAVVDAHEDALTTDEEEAAHERASFWIKDNHDGTMTGQFTVPWASGMVLKKVVDAMTAPRRQGSSEAESGSPAPGTKWQELDWQHRRGLAVADLLLRIPTDHLHPKTAATMLVTMRLEDLQAGLGDADAGVGTGADAGVGTGADAGAGTDADDADSSTKVGSTDTDGVISAGAARRMACGAGIVPVVVGGDSIPLDLGRRVRLFTEHQRLALSTRYVECAAAGCDRPFAWCEVHHLEAWESGGSTDLDNAVPLCGRHHRMVDGPRWRHQVEERPDRTRVLTFDRRRC